VDDAGGGDGEAKPGELAGRPFVAIAGFPSLPLNITHKNMNYISMN
jgi:hypothetical protein